MKYIRFMRTWFFKIATKEAKLSLLGSIVILVSLILSISFLIYYHPKPIVWIEALIPISFLLYELSEIHEYFKNTYFPGIKRSMAQLDKNDVKSLYGKAPEHRFEKFYLTDKFLCVPDICFLTRYSDIESIDIKLKQNYDVVIGDDVVDDDVLFGEISIRVKGEIDSYIVTVREGRYIKGTFGDLTKLIEEKKKKS